MRTYADWLPGLRHGCAGEVSPAGPLLRDDISRYARMGRASWNFIAADGRTAQPPGPMAQDAMEPTSDAAVDELGEISAIYPRWLLSVGRFSVPAKTTGSPFPTFVPAHYSDF